MNECNMNELEIKFNMVKSNNQDFTDDEIDEFNDEFIDLVEKHGYLVGGSIGPYNDDDSECTDDITDMDYIGDDIDEIEDDDVFDPDGLCSEK